MAEVKRFEVDNRQEPTDEDIIAILKKMAKQRKDSIQQYSEGGRPDLEEIEKKELEVLEKYLPQALAGDTLKEAIQTIISENDYAYINSGLNSNDEILITKLGFIINGMQIRTN